MPIAQTLIEGVTVRDDGTIYVLRQNFRLGVLRPDGSSLWRTLPFRGGLASSGRWLVTTYPGLSISDDDGASWRHLDAGLSYLIRMRVLDDGTIVAKGDRRKSICSARGCRDAWDTAVVESNLAGRPWQRASASHVRAIEPRPPAATLPLPLQYERDGIRLALDSHRLPLLSPNDRTLVRYTGASGWRVLFKGDVP